jgi:fatty acid amide hydrolase 2
MPNAAGMVHRRDHIAETDAPAVARLQRAGAIVIGVTNTSEATMWIESDNRLYGRTNNAYNPKRTAGGSSGGEGSAVGAGFAPIGLGTDIGGSIRLPAFFNGVFGHKPTAGLVPNSGQFPNTSGEAGRLLGVGPLARRGEDLMPLLRLLAGADPDDPLSRDAALGDPDAVSLDGLPVALIDGRLIPPVSKELREACDRAAAVLEERGAQVKRVPLRRLRTALEPYLATLKEGAGTTTREILAGEGVEIRARDLVRRGAPHTVATKLLIAAESTFGRLPAGRTRRAVSAGERLASEIEELVGDGVLLHPPFGRPAPRHGTTVGRPWKVLHAAVFNLAGLPATETPLGLGKRGLPLGVQVVAGRDRDHVGIAVARELARGRGGWGAPGTRA